MARPFLLIDGYNLMHAVGMTCRRYGPGEFEKRRRAFLRFLARHLGDDERPRTSIVFDARNPPPGFRRQSYFEAMEILFADSIDDGDADTLIERMIANHSAPKQIVLISSDHRLQRAARKRRAQSIDSEDFAAELERQGPLDEAAERGRTSGANSDPKHGGRIPSGETEFWLNLFGEIPEAKKVSNDWDFPEFHEFDPDD